MIFKAERLARVARAIDDEIFFHRHSFMPADGRDDPSAVITAIAEAALLAADGDDAALAARRATRDAYLAALLDLPAAPVMAGKTGRA